MAKSKNPLFSFLAHGSLGRAITFRRSGQQTIAESIPTHADAKSAAQLGQRTMFQKCTDLWHTLSALEQQTWNSAATKYHMTGYSYYMSLCLKPNPGIYLPLAGGTMSGAIDMATNRILNLPAPAADEEPARKTDLATHATLTTNVHGVGASTIESAAGSQSKVNTHAALTTEVHSFNKSCLAYHSVAQVISHNTWAYLAFNSELWDTDNIHDLVTNNSRLTCKTAGKYIITARATFAANNTGIRDVNIVWNRAASIGEHRANATATYDSIMSLPAIYSLAVNDYIEIQAFQDSGGPLNVTGLLFSMARIP